MSSVKKPKKKIILKVKGWIDNKYVESILLEGRPTFLVINTDSCEVHLQYIVEHGNKVFRPLERDECGYKPYEFTRTEIDYLNSLSISLGGIIKDIFAEVQKYVAAPRRDQILIAGDVVLTYCQEWIDTVHFPFFVGETESGKTTALFFNGAAGYRCLVSTSMSHANIYNFLGTDEEGVGTICEDESQEIGFDKEKMKVYKGAYKRGSLVPRVVTTSSGKTQVYYFSFGCKWFAGERVPNDKAFRERVVIVQMIGGTPQCSLQRATAEERERLNSLRNRMLFWKMQNIESGFEKVESELTNRDQEMWEDFLSVFHGTEFEDDAKETAEYYLKQRGDTIKESLESTIFQILKPELEKNWELDWDLIWYKVTHSDELSGRLDEKTCKTFYPDEFDVRLTTNMLAGIVRFKFQTYKKVRYEIKNGGRKKITSYVFNEKSIKILSKKYRVDDL
jgi:hypothetical protein